MEDKVSEEGKTILADLTKLVDVSKAPPSSENRKKKKKNSTDEWELEEDYDEDGFLKVQELATF